MEKEIISNNNNNIIVNKNKNKNNNGSKNKSKKNDSDSRFAKVFNANMDFGLQIKEHLESIKLQTGLLFFALLGLMVATTFQGLSCWKGDVLPSLFSNYETIEHHPHQGKNFVDVLKVCPYKNYLLIILNLNLTLIIDLFFRYFFLTKSKRIFVVNLLKIIFILSFFIQFSATGLRVYLLFKTVDIWSIFGIILNITVIFISVLSYLELAKYYQSSQVVNFYKNNFFQKLRNFDKSTIFDSDKNGKKYSENENNGKIYHHHHHHHHHHEDNKNNKNNQIGLNSDEKLKLPFEFLTDSSIEMYKKNITYNPPPIKNPVDIYDQKNTPNKKIQLIIHKNK